MARARARRLLAAEEGRVEIESRVRTERGTRLVGWVRGDHAEYRVRAEIREDGTLVDGDCTCPWILGNGLKRGPCKHLLALRTVGDVAA